MSGLDMRTETKKGGSAPADRPGNLALAALI
jgi:hypothetical protein